MKFPYPRGVITIHLREQNALMKRSHTNSSCCVFFYYRVTTIQCVFRLAGNVRFVGF